jgi:hypothetical protein
MKTIRTYFYSTILVSLFLLTGLEALGQSRKIEKTYKWKYQVNESAKITFENYDCNLIIHTWDKSEIQYHMTVKATLKSEEDAGKLDAFLKELKFSNSVGNVEFNNRFWSSKKTVMGRSTITLRRGGKLRFNEFKMKGELWIPESCLLTLNSKYSVIQMDDIEGRLSLDLYNDKLYGGTVKSPLKLKAKYSTLQFENMSDIEADLYSTNIETGNAGDLIITSKYSDFRTGNAGKIRIDAYSDKFSFGNTRDIQFIDKYSDLNAEISGHLKLDCYNSTVDVVNAQDIEINSKYGKYSFDGARNLNLTTSYSDHVKVGSLLSLNINESKYGDYKVNHLDRSLSLKDGYSDKFFVTKAGALKEVKVNGKYIVLEMGLAEGLNYRFNAEVKYPKFDIDEESMNVRIKVKEGSDLKMEAVKGTESEGMPAFFINGYEMAVTLTEKL